MALQAAGNLTPSGIWIAIVVGHATRCGLSVWRFRQEKWREIRIATA
jgi:Na+-driven multidrug efflux pump